jgi:putative tricarboxylic transport membrane protein
VLPLAVGLFGVSEIMLAYGTRAMQPMNPRLSELLPSRTEMHASVGPIGRGTVIGFLIGIIPGSAHILSSFVSYAVEKKLSDHPERFGKGAVEGVAGPESANNAAACGAFVPMLALGVPLGPVQAILIAVLVVHGIAPGPLLITQQPQLFWGFIASMYIGNLVLLILNLPLVGVFVSLLRIPYTYLYPVILICCIVGVYTVNQSMVEVLIMGIAGAAGYGLRKLRYDVAPIVLGFILAPMLEMAFRQSLAMSGGAYTIFLERPITVALLLIGAALLALGLIPAVKQRRSDIKQAAE